jgi:tetratricopeptide (TPR) repeat protein
MPNTLVFFLGAGASWDSGLPLGDAAARYIVKSVFTNIGLDYLYKICEKYEAERKISIWPRFEVVIKIFNDYILNSTVPILETFLNCGISSTCLTLAKLKARKVWLTTNFDNQIELALDREGVNYQVFTDKQKISNISFQKIKHDIIIKLHGDSTEINPAQNLGASIDQILREFPLALIKKLINLIRNNKIFFIGYAARDPDLHRFISGVGNKVHEVSWIDLGKCKPRIKKIVGKNMKYYGQGSPQALKSIFGLDIIKPIRYSETWEQKINKVISLFEKNDLANIAADLSLVNNSTFAFSLLTSINTRLDNYIIFNQYHYHRREIQKFFHSPNKISKESILSHINELEKLRSSISENDLKYKISYCIANTLWRIGNPNKSIKIINPLLKYYNRQSIEYIELLILSGIARIYSGCKYFSKGVKQLEQAKTLAIKQKLPLQAAEACLRLAIGLMRGSDPVRSEVELESVKSTFEEIGNPRQLFIWQLNLAESYRTQRKFKDALIILENLIKIASLAEDSEMIINAKANKALVLVSIGKFNEGDKAFKEVITYTRKFDISLEVRSNALYNRGWLRAIWNNWEEAIRFLKLAAQSYENDFYSPERKGATLSLIGIGYYFIGNKDKSKKILMEIMKEKIVPIGTYKCDFMLLQHLHNTTVPTNTYLKTAKQLFNNDPEQLFYIFYNLLKEKPFRKTYFLECVKCAKKANLKSYWGLLKNHLNNNKIEVKSSTIKLVTKNIDIDFLSINA